MTEYMLQRHAVLCFIPEADGSLADNAGEGGAYVCYVINTIYCENGACTFRIQGRSGGRGIQTICLDNLKRPRKTVSLFIGFSFVYNKFIIA